MSESTPEARRNFNRINMWQLTALNPPEIMARALKATRDTFIELRPYEPPNLYQLIGKLDALPLNTDGKPDSLVNALDVLTDSWSLDRKRCEVIIAEWCL